jgi:hypothetical protein
LQFCGDSSAPGRHISDDDAVAEHRDAYPAVAEHRDAYPAVAEHRDAYPAVDVAKITALVGPAVAAGHKPGGRRPARAVPEYVTLTKTVWKTTGRWAPRYATWAAAGETTYTLLRGSPRRATQLGLNLEHVVPALVLAERMIAGDPVADVLDTAVCCWTTWAEHRGPDGLGARQGMTSSSTAMVDLGECPTTKTRYWPPSPDMKQATLSPASLLEARTSRQSSTRALSTGQLIRLSTSLTTRWIGSWWPPPDPLRTLRLAWRWTSTATGPT